MKKPLTALIIMDGYGVSDGSYGNAVNTYGAHQIKRLEMAFPHTLLEASGSAVGLPSGQMGNSEVGHLNLGAGRIVYQDLSRIGKAIADGSFAKNSVLQQAFAHAKQNGKKLHLIGLTSDGGVHSHISHLLELVRLAKEAGVPQTELHCFTDGRDVSPKSGKDLLLHLQAQLTEWNYGEIVDVCGRYYAMDRDNRWERVEKAYRLLQEGVGKKYASLEELFDDSYAKGITDEFLEPSVLKDGTICDGDAVIFFNFRPDRARELTRAFTQENFAGFARKKTNLFWVCMTQYDASFQNVQVAFAPETFSNTLGEWLSHCGKQQLRVAETEKYAHVTFFFNAGVEKAYEGETRVLISSPKVATYDLKPEMSAYDVTERAEELVRSGRYDVLILNFANCDMVGHTGNFPATIRAVKTVDECVGELTDFILSRGGRVLITADHGNAEKMLEGGKPFTAHTTNPVPFILADPERKGQKLKEGGKLCDVAPTMLQLMGLPIPPEMTGKSLLEE